MANDTVVTRPKLKSVTSADDYCVDVTFADDVSGRVSLKEWVFSIPGLAPLRDPVAFAGATLGEYGWEVEWPTSDIQIGADTLFADLLACY